MVFAMDLIIGMPYFAQRQYWREVINVPVPPAAWIPVVLNAGLQSARAKSTADVNIKTGSEGQGAEFANADWFFNGREENQGIGARKRIHDRT